MTPSDTFACQKYSCTMPARDCILRQRARYAGHGTWKVVAGRVPYQLEYCASGKCAQGEKIKLKLAGQKIEKPRDVNYKAQWAAKRRAAAAKSILPPTKLRAAPIEKPQSPTRKDIAKEAGVYRRVVARALAGKEIRYASYVKLRPILERQGLSHLMAQAPEKPVRPGRRPASVRVAG